MTKFVSAFSIAVLTLFTGCSSAPTAPTATESPTAQSRAQVEWGDYAHSVKVDVDELTDIRDCGGLQAAFDIAYKNDETTRTRVGHGNAKLMEYIDEAMKIADCY